MGAYHGGDVLCQATRSSQLTRVSVTSGPCPGRSFRPHSRGHGHAPLALPPAIYSFPTRCASYAVRIPWNWLRGADCRRSEPSSPEATYSRAGRRACNSVRKHATERADSSRYFVSRTIEKTRMRCLFIRVQALTTRMSGRRNGVVTLVITDVGTYRGGLLAAKELQKHGRQGHTNHSHATSSLCAWRYFTAMFYSSALV